MVLSFKLNLSSVGDTFTRRETWILQTIVFIYKGEMKNYWGKSEVVHLLIGRSLPEVGHTLVYFYVCLQV